MDRRLFIVISGVHRGASFDEVGCNRDSVVERRPLQGQEPVRVDGYAFVRRGEVRDPGCRRWRCVRTRECLDRGSAVKNGGEE